MKIRALALLALPLFCACSQEPESNPAGGGDGASGGSRARAAAPRPRTDIERSDDARAAVLRKMIENGRVEEASSLLPQLTGILGMEGRLLSARLQSLQGDNIGWQRTLNELRTDHPEDPRVFATAAELFCVAGALKEAQRELQEGLAACGGTPELDRAQGIYYLHQTGGAERGLQLLETALHRDPLLPFTGRALNQAHLLIAKEALADKNGEVALAHALKAYHSDPLDVETRRLLADVHAGRAEYDKSLAILRELIDEGRPLQLEYALMHKQAAVVALLEGRREAAIDLFLAARREGLTDDDLGTGLRLLEKEAERLTDLATEALAAKDYDTAREHLTRALDMAPESLEVRHRLGIVLFTAKDYEGAAEHWRRVTTVALEEGIELPDPAHIHLSRALYRAGDVEGARLALEEYLHRRPYGRFIEDTEAQLSLLPK